MLRGIGMVILSGDHEEPTQKLAADLEIDDYFAEVLLVGKANVVFVICQKTKQEKEAKSYD